MAFDAMRIKSKRGLDVAIAAPPTQRPGKHLTSTTCAVMGRDYPGAKLTPLVDVDDVVTIGQPIVRDRRYPDVVLPAYRSGRVTGINRGARRSLTSVTIEGDASDTHNTHIEVSDRLESVELKSLMLTTGLWAALRTRPFDHIPDPESLPTAVLVTATDTQPLAPSPHVVIQHHKDAFAAGVNALRLLSNGPVYVCQSHNSDSNLSPPNDKQIKAIQFSGRHPAGLVGTHIQALCPVGNGLSTVWHIGYQDTIALGYLVSEGRLWHQRTISLAGTAIRHPVLADVPLGGDLTQLLREAVVPEHHQQFSGSVFSGHRVQGHETFLGRFHLQASAMLMPDSAANAGGGWLQSLAPKWLNRSEDAPMLPIETLDQVSPPGVLAAPLLRALLVGDVDRAKDLGALGLAEDDVALLQYCCTSNSDYQALLRSTLEQLA